MPRGAIVTQVALFATTTLACSAIAGLGAANASRATMPPELLRHAQEVLHDLAPEVADASALPWPTLERGDLHGEAAEGVRAEVDAVRAAWNDWRTACRHALDRALDGVADLHAVALRDIDGLPSQPTHAITGWAALVGSLERERAHAETVLSEHLHSIGLATEHMDEVLCRSRRQVWLARNAAQDRTIAGRRRDIFEACARRASGVPAAVEMPALASVFPGWTAALASRVASADAARAGSRQWRAVWAAGIVRFDAELRTEEALRIDRVRRLFSGGRAPPRLEPLRNAARRLDRLQEECADFATQSIALGDDFAALCWRHSDRMQAYPLVTARGVADKLYDQVCAYADRAQTDADGIRARALAAFTAYAREREASEQQIVRIVLRDASRGAPIPYARPEGEPRDPDLEAWERAINRRLDAGRRAVASLGALLPEGARPSAIDRASEMTAEEANNYFLDRP